MKDGFIKVAAASPRVCVADPKVNADRILDMMKKAARDHVKILAFPELSLTGYTCGDLFGQRTLLTASEKELVRLASLTGDMLVIVGCPLVKGGKLFNCAVFMNRGRILGAVPKSHLPNSQEFYEHRNFWPAPHEVSTVLINGAPVPFGTRLLFACRQMPSLVVACEICEDLWVADTPATHHCLAGATVVINPSASDETIGKEEYRRQLIASCSGRLYCGYIYADAGPGESTTDMVFAGHDLIGENGSILAESPLFTNGITESELDLERITSERMKNQSFPMADDSAYQTISFNLNPEVTTLTRPVSRNPFVPYGDQDTAVRCRKILAMQTAGLVKRIDHTHAKTVVVGLSGGLDSTLALLVCAGAMDRLGRKRSDITAVTMPCFGTTKRTRSNAEQLADVIGAKLITVDITKAVQQHFDDIGHDSSNTDVTYENSQARERTQVLMDIANQAGGMVIGTGDLSELALGWATYNGDHMSMYAVNTSIPKTLVRHIVSTVATYPDILLSGQELSAILRDILATPVSPELLPAKDGQISQKTEEIVGPYEIHDFILYYVLRFGFGPAKIYRLAQKAFELDQPGQMESREFLKWLRNFYRRFFAQQFKRSCLPDGPKVGSVTLSPRGDWRMPSDASRAAWMEEAEKLGEAAKESRR